MEPELSGNFELQFHLSEKYSGEFLELSQLAILKKLQQFIEENLKTMKATDSIVAPKKYFEWILDTEACFSP